MTLRRADSVGEHGHRQDEHDPCADDCSGDADAGVANTKVVGGELDGLGEQRVDERGGHRRRREQAEHAELARCQSIGGSPGRSSVGERCFARRVVTTPGDRPADRQGEQPTEPRQLESVGRALLDRRSARVEAHRALVVQERAALLDESPIAGAAFTNNVVTWRQDVLGGSAAYRPRTGDARPVFAALHGRSILAGLYGLPEHDPPTKSRSAISGHWRGRSECRAPRTRFSS